MNCALWLNRRKVYSADEIPDNLDLASLCGYFAAGSLVGWLRSHGGESLADDLEKISPKDPDLKEKLAKIFGGQPIKYKEFGSVTAQENAGLPDIYSSAHVSSGISSSRQAVPNGSSSAILLASSGKSGIYGSFPLWKLKLLGSFNFSSYSFTSYLLNIGFGNAYGGSFSFYSFSSGAFGYEWEWEWERFLASYGSFFGTSFAYGSFASALRTFFAQQYGSWRSFYGSFGFWNKLYGSGNLFANSFPRYFGSYFGGPFGSFGGSFGLKNGQNTVMDSDEYDRILMECVFGCKLNCYGYGIHNI